MSDEANKQMLPRLDHASYLRKTKIATSSTAGRGLFAAVDIKAGDVVMVEKAFAAEYASDIMGEMLTLINVHTDRSSSGTHATLLATLASKIEHNPEAAKPCLTLYTGGYQTAKVTDPNMVPPVDTFHIQAILEYNTFGFPDVRNEKATKSASVEQPTSDVSTASGIWPHASMINHLCTGNTHRTFLSDMMIVRASRDIPKDAEIFLPYRLADEFDVSSSHDMLQKQWGFDCKCAICVSHLNAAGKPSKRVQVLREVKKFTEATVLSSTRFATAAEIKEAESLLKKVEQAYDFPTLFTKGVPRLGYLPIGLWLIRAYATRGI